MKATVNLELDKSDLQYEFSQLVEEQVGDEIRKMVQQKASEMVQAEIEKILEPLVLSLFTEKFPFKAKSSYGSYYEHHATIDEKLKSMVRDYLNKGVYLYSKTSRKPSERYRESNSNDLSLLNRLILDEIAAYIDTEFVPKIREIVDVAVKEKSIVEEEIRQKTLAAIAEKLK